MEVILYIQFRKYIKAFHSELPGFRYDLSKIILTLHFPLVSVAIFNERFHWRNEGMLGCWQQRGMPGDTGHRNYAGESFKIEVHVSIVLSQLSCEYCPQCQYCPQSQSSKQL